MHITKGSRCVVLSAEMSYLPPVSNSRAGVRGWGGGGH